jgi:hypothetical protein
VTTCSPADFGDSNEEVSCQPRSLHGSCA